MKHVSVWLDTTSDVHGWIVSLDIDDTTDTIRVFPPDEYGYRAATTYATEYARRNELPKAINCDFCHAAAKWHHKFKEDDGWLHMYTCNGCAFICTDDYPPPTVSLAISPLVKRHWSYS